MLCTLDWLRRRGYTVFCERDIKSLEAPPTPGEGVGGWGVFLTIWLTAIEASAGERAYKKPHAATRRAALRPRKRRKRGNQLAGGGAACRRTAQLARTEGARAPERKKPKKQGRRTCAAIVYPCFFGFFCYRITRGGLAAPSGRARIMHGAPIGGAAGA